jgi:cell division protein FtsB
VKKIIDRIWDYIRLNPKKFFFQVAFILFLFWIFFDDYGVLKRIRMEAEYRTLLEQDKIEQKKILDNELRIQHAHEPDSIEQAAREKYNYRKPGETLFIIRSH